MTRQNETSKRKRWFSVEGQTILFDGDSLRFYLGEADVAHLDVPQTDWTEDASTNDPHFLMHALVNVANVCTLKCVYCFAKGGSYGHRPSLMTPETIERTVKALSHYKRIQAVTFYGGEPTLNVQAIHTIVDALSDRVGTFALITNGLSINEEEIDFLARNKFQVTVSIDGPQNVHDHLRGGYSSTLQTITSLASRDGIQLRLSARYTRIHAEQGLSLPKLHDFFRETFPGVPYFIGSVNESCGPSSSESVGLVPVSGDNLETEIEETISFLTSKEPKSHSCSKVVTSVIASLILRNGSRYFCSKCSSSHTLNFDVDGSVRPCHILFGVPGTIKTQEGELLQRCNDKLAIDGCDSCWAWLLCRRCPIGMEEHDLGRDPESCPIALFSARVIEAVLVVRQDELRYRRFASRFSRVYQELHAVGRLGQ